ncbi:MAG: hypothetical protein LBI34_01105 [Puniceicoccales bacterium]|nr:hypothetical protein [Puniceicoccales bacterium]
MLSDTVRPYDRDLSLCGDYPTSSLVNNLFNFVRANYFSLFRISYKAFWYCVGICAFGYALRFRKDAPSAQNQALASPAATQVVAAMGGDELRSGDFPVGEPSSDWNSVMCENFTNEQKIFSTSPNAGQPSPEEVDMMVRFGQEMKFDEILRDSTGAQQVANDFMEYLASVESASGTECMKECVSRTIQYVKKIGGDSAILAMRGFFLGFMPNDRSRFSYVMLIGNMLLTPEERQEVADRIAGCTMPVMTISSPRVEVVSESPLALQDESTGVVGKTIKWVQEKCSVA